MEPGPLGEGWVETSDISMIRGFVAGKSDISGETDEIDQTKDKSRNSCYQDGDGLIFNARDEA